MHQREIHGFVSYPVRVCV